MWDEKGRDYTTAPVDISIPPHAKEGKLIVGTGADQHRFVLDRGNLTTVTEPSRAIQGLGNLGFGCGLNKVTWQLVPVIEWKR